MYKFLFALLMGFVILGANEVVLYENPRDSSDWAYKGRQPLQFAVAASPEEWESQLSRMEPRPPRVREIDWETEFPILAYMGEYPTGGYAVQIDSVRLTRRTLVVQVSLRSPAPGDMVTMAFTYPADMITLPRQHLPNIDQVRFVSRDGELYSEMSIIR